MPVNFPRMVMSNSTREAEYDGSVNGAPMSAPKDISRIACARCRRLKIKCIVDDQEIDRCKRCVSSKSVCEDAVSTKKSLKRKDSDRVADLESTVEQLRSAIDQMKNSEKSPSSLNTSSSSPGKEFELPPIQSLNSSSTKSWGPPRMPNPQISILCDQSTSQINKLDTEGIDELIRSKIVSQSELIALYESIEGNIASAVRIPSGKTYWDLYRTRPILLQVLITIASSTDPLLFPVLSERMKNRLLYEYFVNSTRRIDLLQGFMLSCEFCLPGDQANFWILQSYAVLATEVALDLKLYQPPSKPRTDQFDELEYERTLLSLYSMHTGMLSASRRQPQRVQWTDYHAQCKQKLEASNMSDRHVALMTDLLRLGLEIIEAGPHLASGRVVKSFAQRINVVENSFDLPPEGNPQVGIGIAGLRLSLHESHLRTVDLNDALNTQGIISRETCMGVADTLLTLVENMRPDKVYPSYLYIKPLHALLLVCKMTRYTKAADDDGWTQSYANRADTILSRHGMRGQGLARLLGGKAGAIVRWWKTSSDLTREDNFVDILQRVVNTVDSQAVTSPNDFDFQMFVELFNIDPDTLT